MASLKLRGAYIFQFGWMDPITMPAFLKKFRENLFETEPGLPTDFMPLGLTYPPVGASVDSNLKLEAVTFVLAGL